MDGVSVFTIESQFNPSLLLQGFRVMSLGVPAPEVQAVEAEPIPVSTVSSAPSPTPPLRPGAGSILWLLAVAFLSRLRALSRGRKLLAFFASAGLFFLLPVVSAAQVVEYYHLDALGNVRAVTNQAGQVIERHDYLPFGEEWCGTGPCGSLIPGQPKRFTGKERDAETGLDYFGARYYGSKIGRFTTVDPYLNTTAALVDPQRWNRYAYGRNNPLRYVDPDGRDIFTYFGGLVTAFGSNLSGGLIARPTSSDSDFRFGQTVGDTFSLAAAGYEGSVGGGLIVGGGGATLTVAGGTVGVPAAVGGGLLVGHAAAFGASALIHLSSNTREGMGFTKAGKRQIDQANAERYGGQNVCENCGTEVQPGKQHEKGVTPPGNERQRDHIVPRSKGGRGSPDNGQVLCRDCNIDKSDKQP